MKRLTLVLSLAGLAAFASPLAAQDKRGKSDDIPPGHRPPPGMCRIWIDDVPPGQQPAPTDCATAVRNRPANGRVIFGDDYTKRGGRTKKVKDVNRLVPPSREENDEHFDPRDRANTDGARDDRGKRRGK